MTDESSPAIGMTLEQEEALLRERLDKIALFKKLAHELGQPLNPTAVSAVAPVKPVPQSFDGTIGGLIDRYLNDERSPFFQLSHKSRNSYLGAFSHIRDEFGSMKIADIDADFIKAKYEGWTAGSKYALGHHFVAKLRLLSGFGVSILNDDDCLKFSTIMRVLRFKIPNSRVEQMTAEYAVKFRSKAHDVNWPSLALAQAIQFDLRLRAVDVIGEWVPISEPGSSEIIWGEEKWMRGLRWSDIDDKMMLRLSIHDRLKRYKKVEVDLTECRMVMQELDRLGDIPRKGPIIICEPTGRPYTTAEFRRKWRLVANKAGLPDNIRNGDSIRSESVVETGLRKKAAGA
jgi:hypothetical protein